MFKSASFFLVVLAATLTFGCNGSSNNAPKDPSVLGVESTSTGKRVIAKLVGSEIVVSAAGVAGDDRQSPYVIYLADRNIYFCVWEDYRNRNVTGADIYGQFINVDGSFCGSDFWITQATGNESLPTAAYRQVNNDKPAGKIVVTWQDDRKDDSGGGYVYYSTITNIPEGAKEGGTCGAVNPKVSANYPLGYNGTDAYGVNSQNYVDVSLSPLADGTNKTFGKVLEPYVDPTTIVVKATIAGQTEMLFGDGKGGFSGAGAGVLNPVTGSMTVAFTVAPDAGKAVTVTYDSVPFKTTGSTGDKLLSRKQPKITYDSNRDLFWIVWTESRDKVNSYSDLCFDVLAVNKEFGDGVYPGYIMLNAKTDTAGEMAAVENANKLTGADIIRNGKTRKNRLITQGDPNMTPQAFEYEFFTSVNNVALASASNAPEALIAWEGVKQKIGFSCAVDTKGIITVTFTEPGPVDGGKAHIYAMFDKEISQKAVKAKQVDKENTAAASNYPALAFDPLAQRFLVAWEDLRDGPKTKIYGQFLYSGGDLYSSNRIISFSDTNGDNIQDANVANSSQTRPFITYDSVRQNYFVSWQDGRNGSVSLENLDIYGQMLNSEGSSSGANYAISTVPGSQLNPIVAYNSNAKQFFAVWKHGVTQSDIHGQLFSLGNPVMTLLKQDKSPLTPALINFGTSTVNQLSRFTFLVRNSGDTNLKLDCVKPSLAPPFSFENLPTELGACDDDKVLDLSPSSETAFTVKYLPTTAGTFIGNFTLNSDAGNSTVSLQGIGILPSMQIIEGDGGNDGTLNFGTLPSGETKDLALTITNNSTITYSIISIAGLGGPFSLVNSPTLPVTLSAGASMTINIRYKPTAEGVVTAQLTINTDKSIAPQINLTGTASASATPTVTNDTTGSTGTTTTPAPSSGGKGGCFIATAAYGSYLDPHVMVLRNFRDHVLLKTSLGTAFVKFYYHYSPPFADFIRQHEVLRVATRWMLTPLIFGAQYTKTSGILSIALLGFGLLLLRRRSQV